MGYWSEQCEQARVIKPELGAMMPVALTLQQMDELAEEFPPTLETFLAERHFLLWDIVVGDESELELPEPPPEKILEGVIDHKAVHIVHRDNKARFVCSREPRPDTYVLHPEAFPQAHRAGLLELTRFPFLRPAIAHAQAQFLAREEGSDADYSIFLSTAIGDQLVHLNINPGEERRILEAYQSAVLNAASPQIYGHSHRTPRLAPVKQALLLKKHVPHLKRISPAADLDRPDSSIWVKNIKNS